MATIGPGQELRGEFDFADDGFAERAGLHQRRRVHGNAGADDDQVLSAEGALAMAAGFDGDAMIEQNWDLFAQLVRRLGIGDGDASAALFEE